MKKNYMKKSSADIQKEITTYIDHATEKIDSYLTSKEDINELLTFMAQFHHYSFRNQSLIHDQFEGAKAVGSFKTFSDAGFRINKGEKAIKVLVPTPYTTFLDQDGKLKQVSNATTEEKNLIKANKLETKKQMGYKLGNVFDVSQTNATAKDLPKIFPNRHYDFSFSGNEERLLRSLKELSEKKGVPVHERMDIGVVKGRYVHGIQNEQWIDLNQRFDDRNKIATLIHEMAHATLHHTKDGLTSAEREFQAELVSNVVSKHFGLETDEKSISYIATWTNNGEDISDKRQLIKEVQETASSFITTIHQEYDVADNENKQDKETQKLSNVTKEEIDNAKQVSILEVASVHGYQTNQHSHKEHRLVENHSVAIFSDTNSFYDFGQNTGIKGGDSIAFVQQVIGVKDFKEAVHLLNNDDFEKVTIQVKEKIAYQYDATKESHSFNRAQNYLTQERGIDTMLVDQLHQAGYIREDQRGNVLFCWYDKSKMVGCTEQGTIQTDKYARGSWKKIQENSPSESHGFNIGFGEPHHLKFFEASIDLLSYASLHPEKMKDTWLISMEGFNESKMLDYIKRSHDQTGAIPKSISVCVDNDSSGLNFMSNLSLIKKELVMNEIPKKPAGMEQLDKWDWNNQLCFFQQQSQFMQQTQNFEREM